MAKVWARARASWVQGPVLQPKITALGPSSRDRDTYGTDVPVELEFLPDERPSVSKGLGDGAWILGAEGLE